MDVSGGRGQCWPWGRLNRKLKTTNVIKIWCTVVERLAQKTKYDDRDWCRRGPSTVETTAGEKNISKCYDFESGVAAANQTKERLRS